MTTSKYVQRINIEMGSNLLINIQGIEGRLKSHLIGLIPSEFIVIKAPIGHSGIREKFFEGNKVTVRYIQHGQAYGFESDIITLVTKPKTMLIIDYPIRISTVSLRKAERYDCYIPCSLEIEGESLSCTIMDISLTGCRCMVPELSAMTQKTMEKDEISIRLKFESPSDNETIELPASIAYNADYKSVSKVGVAFNDLDDEAQRRLVRITDFLERQ